MSSWPGGISAITLFVEDVLAAKQFYLEVFGLPVVYEDDNSAVFKFGQTLINLLKITEAPDLVEHVLAIITFLHHHGPSSFAAATSF